MSSEIVYNIFLCITCILQIYAAVMAVRLTKVTRYKVSWILVSVGLGLMAIKGIINIMGIFIPGFGFKSDLPFTWGGIFVSLCFVISVFLIRKIFIYIREADARQRAYEKELLKTVVQAEENERKRFATELHDGLGPLLSSIKMGFSAISSEISDVEIRKNLEQAIAEAIVTVREVSNNLSPHIVSTFGIEKAVRNFMAKLVLPKDFVIECDLTLGERRYASTKEIVVYRVFCELLNNTLRHAKADKVWFAIREDHGMIVLTYCDNGIGFDPESLQDASVGGYGYYNIISRVSSLKGTSDFRRLADGMRVEIKVPVEE
ncbi:MAG: histidine kinase [Bacteroidales bacterium]|nr:histidine kinase [Bacteroidales bacterium]